MPNVLFKLMLNHVVLAGQIEQAPSCTATINFIHQAVDKYSETNTRK